MKSFGITSVLLLTLVLASTSTVEAQVLRPGELCGDHADAAIATFEDADLEVAIRAALSVGAQDDLTCGLVATLANLTAIDAGIVSMVGVQNLMSLTILDISSNRLTGAIPTELGNLSSLEVLILRSNQLTGAIPLEVAQLGGLIQNTYGSSRCDFLPGNTGLFIPDADGFRAADLDADGFICGVVVPPSPLLSAFPRELSWTTSKHFLELVPSGLSTRWR